jgi:2-pyrone-4,6-dicarboxylate lactonase
MRKENLASSPAPPPFRELRRPNLELPPGACDTHFHIIGPQSQFPLNPRRSFVPGVDHEDSTIEDWEKLQNALGLSRGLLIQSMMYYPSYELALHCLCRLPDRLRGVVMPHPSITDRELDILSSVGVVGARFTPSIGRVLDQRFVGRLSEFGWGMHYLLGAAEPALAGQVRAEENECLADWRRKILASSGKFVLEHMGSAPVEQGINGPGFRFVLECIDTGRCWVKLSPRISNHRQLPFSDVKPLVDELVERAPNRLLWGSDWPHPQYWRPMQSDSDLLDLMLDWVPDANTRDQIFVNNPMCAFGFPRIG